MSNELSVEFKAGLSQFESAFRTAFGLMDEFNSRAQTLNSSFSSVTTSSNNFSSSFNNGLQSAVGFASGLFGLNSAAQAIKSTFSTIVEFDTLENTMHRLTGSTAEYNVQMGFVTSLAERNAQDIGVLATQFNLVNTAAKGTKLEGKGVRDIFEGISDAGAFLHLTNDKIAHALYAVKDMMSKGTIQAEELKRQMGNALPGAVNIFANALGVSVTKLLDMSKHGELLSAEVLPKVAEYMKKTFGEGALNNINTMAGSMTNLTNEFKLFVNEFANESHVKSFFTTVTNGIAGVFSTLRQGIKSGDWVSFFGALTGNVSSIASLQANAAADKVQDETLRNLTSDQRKAKLKIYVDKIKNEKAIIDELRTNKYADNGTMKQHLDYMLSLKKAFDVLARLDYDSSLSILNSRKSGGGSGSGKVKPDKGKHSWLSLMGLDTVDTKRDIVETIDKLKQVLRENMQGLNFNDVGFDETKNAFQIKSFEKAGEELQKKFHDTFKQLKVPSLQQLGLSIQEQIKKNVTDRAKLAFIEFKNEITDLLQNSIGNSIGNLFQDIFSGKNIAQSLSNSLANILSMLGDYLIQFALKKMIVDTTVGTMLKAIGLEALPSDIGALAIGAGLKGLTGLIQPKGYASGGIFSGEQTIRVGEYGNAKHNPEVVAPLDKLQSMMGNSRSGFNGGQLVAVVKGQDLHFILSEYNRRNG